MIFISIWTLIPHLWICYFQRLLQCWTLSFKDYTPFSILLPPYQNLISDKPYVPQLLNFFTVYNWLWPFFTSFLSCSSHIIHYINNACPVKILCTIFAPSLQILSFGLVYLFTSLTFTYRKLNVTWVFALCMGLQSWIWVSDWTKLNWWYPHEPWHWPKSTQTWFYPRVLFHCSSHWIYIPGSLIFLFLILLKWDDRKERTIFEPLLLINLWLETILS